MTPKFHQQQVSLKPVFFLTSAILHAPSLIYCAIKRSLPLFPKTNTNSHAPLFFSLFNKGHLQNQRAYLAHNLCAKTVKTFIFSGYPSQLFLLTEERATSMLSIGLVNLELPINPTTPNFSQKLPKGLGRIK